MTTNNTPRPDAAPAGDLTRWERYYLESSRRGVYASFPRNCKHADSLIDKGYIKGFGFVMGNRVEHNLTQKGIDIWEAAYAKRHATATD